jgi:hypothetical protein
MTPISQDKMDLELQHMSAANMLGVQSWDEFRELANKVGYIYQTGTPIYREDILRFQQLVRSHECNEK